MKNIIHSSKLAIKNIKNLLYNKINIICCHKWVHIMHIYATWLYFFNQTTVIWRIFIKSLLIKIYKSLLNPKTHFKRKFFPSKKGKWKFLLFAHETSLRPGQNARRFPSAICLCLDELISLLPGLQRGLDVALLLTSQICDINHYLSEHLCRRAALFHLLHSLLFTSH